MRLFTMTLSDWNTVFQFASAALLGLTFAVGVGAIVTGHILNKRQAVLVAEAKRDTERLKLQVEEESKERIKAEVELAKLKKQIGPRQLDREAFLKALVGQPKAPVEILYLRDDPDSLEFAQEIGNLLERAGWAVLARGPIPPPPPRSGADIPMTVSGGGRPAGVTVGAGSVSEEGGEAARKRAIGREDWVRTPWTVLSDAFGKSMGKSQAAGNVATCPEGIVRVVVGPRR